MTTFAKTWQYDFNRNCYDTLNGQGPTRSVLFYIKDFLTGHVGGATLGLWTVYYSCDGVTAGSPGDLVDRWGTTYDRTKLVVAADGVAHSWTVLKSSTTPALYLILDYSNGSSLTTSGRLLMSKDAPTDGSVTNAPAPANEWGWPTSEYLTFAEDTTRNHRMNGWLSTDGSMFVIATGMQGAGCLSFALLHAKLADANPLDQYPYVLAGAFYAYTRGAWTSSVLGHSASSVRMRNWDGDTAASSFIEPFAAGSIYAFYYISKAGLAPSGDHPDWPIWVINCETASSKSLIRGRIEDVFYCSSNMPIPSAEPNNAPPQSIIFGDFWLPGTDVPLL